MKNYDHRTLEKKWQRAWAESGIYAATEDPSKSKRYVLDMFPYPSGEGLHVGHPKGYIATDVYSRHLKMKGNEVLHPMGWDAFGLPAENFAIKNKIHPRVAVEKNINRFKEQLASVGFNYDWNREIHTTDPSFYKWTQWIFLKLLERGLAYQSFEPINWCSSCQTGLANEDLDRGACERCGSAVEKRPMRQWMLRITDYADRLLEDLDLLPLWPEHIKESQRHWIGKSEGAEIGFPLKDLEEKITVFTTRPDTLFGATYMVLAPEHPLIGRVASFVQNKNEVDTYIRDASKKTEIERTDEEKEKTGIELKGVRAIHPVTREELPVFIADYVLGHYGTGAIMAVPAHDERDYAFAEKFGLPIRQVIEPLLIQTTGSATFRHDEPVQDSCGVIVIVKHWSEEKYIGLRWPLAGWGTLLTGGIDEGFTPEETVIKEIREETGYTDAKIARKLGVIHSKYYHEPKKTNRFGHTPAFYVELQSDARQEVDPEEMSRHEMLWLSLQELRSFLTATSHQEALRLLESPVYTGEGILVNSNGFDGMGSEEAKAKITEVAGGTITSTYKLRDWVFSRQRYWGEPIPVIHCETCGVVPVPERDLPVFLPDVESYEPTGTGESPLAAIPEWVQVPCPKCGGEGKRETNTMPQWAGSSWYYLRFMDPDNDAALVEEAKERYWAPVDMYVGGAEHATRHLIYARFWHKFLYDEGVVSTKEPFTALHSVGLIMAEDGRKMSKRYGNVINPDEIVETYGADTLRVYEMFMGPFENAIAWNTDSMIGARRFIERVWRAAGSAGNEVLALRPLLHRTIQKVENDILAFKFNTAISQLMILLNAIEKEGVGKAEWGIFLKLLAPFAPHVAEELWHEAGNDTSIHQEAWPQFDPSFIKEDEMVIVIQIDGKVRGEIRVAVDTSEADIVVRAKGAVEARLKGEEVLREIYVPGRLVNIVTRT